MNPIGRILLAVREPRCLSREQVARRLGVPDQIVIAFVPKFGLYRFGGDPAHFPEFR
jgi:hypothetical protein